MDGYGASGRMGHVTISYDINMIVLVVLLMITMIGDAHIWWIERTNE